MVIDDQNTYINKIGGSTKRANIKNAKNLPQNVETFSNFLKNKIEGEAKNDLFTEIVTLGEGNHKYHHDNPSEYRYSKYDVTGIAIKTFLKNDWIQDRLLWRSFTRRVLPFCYKDWTRYIDL